MCRELPFMLPLRGMQIDGTIDCLYQDTTGVQDLARAYETQIKIYGAACLQTLNLDEIQLALHFLSPGILHSQHFTKAAAAQFFWGGLQKLLSPQ